MRATPIVTGLAVWLCGLGPVGADDSVTVIRAGRLIDTQAGRVLENQTIVVRNGRIAEFGSQLKQFGMRRAGGAVHTHRPFA